MSPRTTTHLTTPQFDLLDEVLRKGSVRIVNRWQSRVAYNLIDRRLVKADHVDFNTYLSITEAGMVRHKKEKERRNGRHR